MRYVVAEFADMKFSTDGRLVYFSTPAWATSSAVHVVDTTTRKEHLVCPGSLLQVIHSPKGDQLVVSQKRYSNGAYWRKYLLTTRKRNRTAYPLPLRSADTYSLIGVCSAISNWRIA